jgi:ParB-like chromosome segregation protein Spo0J
MKIEKVKIAELNPAEYNPRRMTNKQYEDLRNSLEKFGLVDPIIINSDNTVVGGHQRLRIMRELGAELVPVVRVNLSKEDEKELNIRLNKNTGEFDLDVLANNFEVDELKDWGFKDVELGFNTDKIQTDLSDSIELQYKIEVDVTSEKEQEQLYNDLTNKGYICRILTL